MNHAETLDTWATEQMLAEMPLSDALITQDVDRIRDMLTTAASIFCHLWGKDFDPMVTYLCSRISAATLESEYVPSVVIQWRDQYGGVLIICEEKFKVEAA